MAHLGPEGRSEEEQLREVELRGRLMFGMPPRDAEEWAFAESLFTEEALEPYRKIYESEEYASGQYG
jgi:hypothetical protein